MFFDYIPLISESSLRCISEVLQALYVVSEDSKRKIERTMQQPSWHEHQTIVCFFTAIDARHCNGPQDAEISSE
jgi:hypothetical protein